jgi:hypothetical protein
MAVDSGEGVNLSTRGERPRRRRKLWPVLGGLLCLAVVSLLVMRWHWRAEFHRRIAAIRAAGFPVTGEELNAWYPWPQAGDNAADWITGAATLLRKLAQEEGRPLEALLRRMGDRLRPTEPLPPDLKASWEQYVRDNAKALESLHAPATVAESRYPLDFSAVPGGVLMPHLSGVGDSCRLLCLEAIVRAEDQDADGTAKAVETIVHVAQSLEKEPTVVSCLVRMVNANAGVVALERALNRVRFTEGQLARLQEAFQDLRPDEGLRRGLAGNRCMLLPVFEKPQILDRQVFDSLPPVPLLEAYSALGLSAREGIIFLDYMDECLRIAQLPAFEQPAAIEAAETGLRHRKGILLRQARYMPELIRRVTQEGVWSGLAVTALAVERYRLARGGLPQALDQLVPDYLAAVPQDPFDGTPLRYQRTDRGFLVYSVGEDGKDDGGKERGAEGQGESYDLLFRVERPSAGIP